MQNVTVQVLQAKNFKATADSLPTKIENTFEVPKVFEMINVTNLETVTGFIEFELIKLAEKVNVSGNLTDSQIQIIARYLVSEYPNETIADFKICFERASTGAYGKIWKLDGIEVGMWVRSYLEDKYVVMESQLMNEKEQYKNKIHENTEWLNLWKDAVAAVDAAGGVETHSRNHHNLSYLKSITDKEIKEQGQEKPKAIQYPSTSTSELIKRELHFRYVTENYDPRTAEKLKTWISESEWIDKNT